MKYYRVTFLTKKGEFCDWAIDVAAETAKDAVLKAKKLWIDSKHDMHMFRVKAKLIRGTETIDYHWFTSADRWV